MADILDGYTQALKEIGQGLAKDVPNPWDRVWVEITAFEGGGGFDSKFCYEQAGQIFERKFTATSAMPGIHKLYDTALKSDKGIWKKVIYTLTNDGKFDTKFEY